MKGESMIESQPRTQADPWHMVARQLMQVLPVLGQQIAKAMERTEEAVREITHRFPAIAQHVSGNQRSDDLTVAITALQFQDITKQQLDHVIGGLRCVEQALRAMLADREHVGVTQAVNILTDLEQRFTMQGERDMLALVRRNTETQSPSGGSRNQQHDVGDNVTLF
jgi:hypothetical protein